MNGKGSKLRPYSVKYSQYCDNWEAIFKKKPKKKKEIKNETSNGN